MMYLALDIGNSNIVVGVFKEKKDAFDMVHSFRLVTPLSTTTDELALAIKNMLMHHSIDLRQIKAAIFSSVVPSLNHNITKLMQVYFNIKIEMVTHDYFTNFKIDYQEREDLGIDRLINVKAAQRLFGAPAIVIDFGTAITIDVLSAPATYAGGLILPGIAISLDALTERTSQLPKVELEYPQTTLGHSTKQSIQNGIFFLYKTSVENIIKMIEAQYFPRSPAHEEKSDLAAKPAPPTIIATGGLAPFITHAFEPPLKTVPALTLLGLKILLDEKASTHADS